MSCFVCYQCGEFKDSDAEECHEYKETELICESCYESNLEDDSCTQPLSSSVSQ